MYNIMGGKSERPKLLSREEYYVKRRAGEFEGCAFCNWHKQRLIKEFNNWVWIDNLSPYWSFYAKVNGKYKKVPSHTLVIPKTHKKEFKELSPQEAIEFLDVYNEIMEAYRKVGYYYKTDEGFKAVTQYVQFLRIRDDGNPSKTDHFHYHFSPDRENGWDGAVDFKAYDVEEDKNVLELFDAKIAVV